MNVHLKVKSLVILLKPVADEFDGQKRRRKRQGILSVVNQLAVDKPVQKLRAEECILVLLKADSLKIHQLMEL